MRNVPRHRRSLKPEWYDRAVIPSVLVTVGVMLWLLIVPAAYWTAFFLLAIILLWIFSWLLHHYGVHEIGLALSVFSLLFVLAFYWNMAVQQNQSYSAFLKSSPCGQSSCSHAIDQIEEPYSAGAWFPSIMGVVMWYSINLNFCYCPGCHWADNNTLPIYGYPPINGTVIPDTSQAPIANGGYATTNPSDFPNGGIGIPAGVYPGTGSTVPTTPALCPGVAAVLNSRNVLGRGCPICSQCLQWLRLQQGHIDPFTDDVCCPASLYPSYPSGMCTFCPSTTTCPYVGQITNALLVVFCFLVVNWILEFVYP